MNENEMTNKKELTEYNRTRPGLKHLSGDVYASFDGTAVIVSTPRASGSHWIALDAKALCELMDYAREHGI